MTRNDDELTKLRRAFAEPEAPALQPAGCPEPDLIWEAVRGELPPEEVREIVDHVAVCSPCAEDWRIAKAFEEESRTLETAETADAADIAEAPSNVIRPSFSRFRPWLAAAAAALVLTVAGIQLRPEKPVYRGDDGAVVTLATPSASRESFVLAWEPAAGAESYELLVSTPDLATVDHPTGLTATQHRVPESRLSSIPSGTRIRWLVTAVYPDGSKTPSPAAATTLE